MRPYQQEAVEAVYRHLREREDNPCVVIPTAGGKTPVMATICRDAVKQWGGRVVILAHVKELLQQAADKLQRICPDIRVGVYSAGLNSRDTRSRIIVAGIQSVYEKACELGPFDLALVDEAHMIPVDGEGMYRSFLKDAKVVSPHLRVIGLTATPFRMKSGWICGPENILNAICYEVGVRELIVQGFICRLVSKAGLLKPDTSNLAVRAGEFVAKDTEALMNQDALVTSACREIAEYTKDRHACLVFTSGVEHGHHVAAVLSRLTGVEVGEVYGDTPPWHRELNLEDFKSGKLRYLVNVNVLTTGFDAPNIDAVAILRPTMSPGLYYQMVGRGFRLHPGKDDCLVLDFGSNIVRHGPVDQLRIGAQPGSGEGEAPAKECPQCHSVIAAGYGTCPDCGYVFTPPDRQKHEAKAGEEGILSGETTFEDVDVQEVFYAWHKKKGADDGAPITMRVDYCCGLNRYESEWVCPEHVGYARAKFDRWWTTRSQAPIPNTADEAVKLAQAGALAKTTRIRVRRVSGERFARIVAYQLGDIPAWGGTVPAATEPDESPIDETKVDGGEVDRDVQSIADFFGGEVAQDDDIPF